MAHLPAAMSGTPDLEDLADEVRLAFTEIERTAPPGALGPGECLPPLDVLETDEAIELLIDLPGVPAWAVRVLVKDRLAIVAGQKPQPAGEPSGGASFHLVERTFGRFIRAVRVAAACDAGRARARIQSGVLCLTLPKVAERRGRAIPVEIEVE